MSDGDEPASIHDEIEALLAEEGDLGAADRAKVDAHLAECAACRGVRDQIGQMKNALSGLRRVPAPPAFRDQVTETIHTRSAGRFFGKRVLGDRVPFGPLLIVALIVLIAAAVMLWSSSTGSLSVEPKRKPPPPTSPAVPTP